MQTQPSNIFQMNPTASTTNTGLFGASGPNLYAPTQTGGSPFG